MESLNDIFKNIAEAETNEKIPNIKTAAQVNGVSSKCEDQFVAIIEITKEKVAYIENDFSKRKNSKEYENEKYLDTIALVLESPHKEEFKNMEEIAPAKGTTGKNIEAMLLGNLAKYIYINDIQQQATKIMTDLEDVTSERSSQRKILVCI